MPFGFFDSVMLYFPGLAPTSPTTPFPALLMPPPPIPTQILECSDSNQSLHFSKFFGNFVFTFTALLQCLKRYCTHSRTSINIYKVNVYIIWLLRKVTVSNDLSSAPYIYFWNVSGLLSTYGFLICWSLIIALWIGWFNNSLDMSLYDCT